MTSSERDRPRWHLTPPRGWMNDPVGVFHHRGRYHLFYQHHPHSTVWDVACAWGHATGPDLVRWRHLPAALEPGDGDDGCWSGSAVVDGGTPVIAYTSVQAKSAAVGRVRFARPADARDADLVAWAKEPYADVQPPDVGVAHLRDPYLVREGPRWRMLLGAGLADGTPAVLGWSSTDLLRWSFDGVTASGDAGAAAAVDLGQLWECPQLLDVDGLPVLVVSVWRDDVLDQVVCAVGERRGDGFRARAWQPLLRGGVGYAATTFRDAHGRPCAVAWLRADPQRATWAGVLTAPVVLSVDGSRVAVAPHPDVDTLRGDLVHDGPLAGGVDLSAAHGCADVLIDTGNAVTEVVLETAEGVEVPVPCRGPARLLLDVGVVETFTGGGEWTALRTPGLHVTAIRGVSGTSGSRVRAWVLVPPGP